MGLLTRTEELILMAIWRLKDNAYCVPIHRYVSDITAMRWSFGSIYMPLDRLGHVVAEDLPEPGQQLALGLSAESGQIAEGLQAALLDDVGRIEPGVDGRVHLPLSHHPQVRLVLRKQRPGGFGIALSSTGQQLVGREAAHG